LEAVSGAELIVGILSDYTTSHALVHTPDVAAAMRGKTLLQLASGSPSQARWERLGRALTACGTWMARSWRRPI
jgi:hypothetical protein